MQYVAQVDLEPWSSGFHVPGVVISGMCRLIQGSDSHFHFTNFKALVFTMSIKDSAWKEALQYRTRICQDYQRAVLVSLRSHHSYTTMLLPRNVSFTIIYPCPALGWKGQMPQGSCSVSWGSLGQEMQKILSLERATLSGAHLPLDHW